MSVLITALYGFALLPCAACFSIAVYLLFARCYGKLAERTFVEFSQKIDPYLKVQARLLSLAQTALTLPLLLLLAAALLDRPDSAAAQAVGRPAPRRWEATVYLPLADNRGQSFEETAWHEALEKLVTPFGGATLGPPQEGCWLDARRRVCREPIRPVVVSFTPERLEEFRHAVHTVGKHLGQEAMYVRFEEPRVELIPVSAARAAEDR